MHITLCIDLGNTRKKAAIFRNDLLVEVIPLADFSIDVLEPIFETFKPDTCVVAAVIPVATGSENFIATKCKYIRIRYTSKLNFSTPVPQPQTIGADRLALAAAAVALFPNQHNLVIAAGTCITYNFITAKHQFIGGSISPGLNMRFKALHNYTAALPLAKTTWNVPVIAYDTITNIQTGVQLGTLFEMQGILKQYSSQYANFNAVLTGGDTPYFAAQLKTMIFADQNFLFKGLYALSLIN